MRAFSEIVPEGVSGNGSVMISILSEAMVGKTLPGVATVTSFLGGRVRRLQTGSINAYLYVIVIAVIGVMVAQVL